MTENDTVLNSLWTAVEYDHGKPDFVGWSILADRYEDLGIDPGILAALRWMVEHRKRPFKFVTWDGGWSEITDWSWMAWNTAWSREDFPSDEPGEAFLLSDLFARLSDGTPSSSGITPMRFYPTLIDAVRDLARALEQAEGETR